MEMENLEGKYWSDKSYFSFDCKTFEQHLEGKENETEKELEEEDLEGNYHNSDSHYNSSVRVVKIFKSSLGLSDTYGFHLTRSKWDPYPWVSAVDVAAPAALAGLKAGDCILKVNGEDIVGLRIRDIAEKVQTECDGVTLLVWNCGMVGDCDPESLCCAPLPLSLQRLSVIVESILSIIECPVCQSTIPPPAMQCQNGHLLCVDCRIRAARCPVCRDCYTPRRALIAEQIYSVITNAFQMPNNSEKLRQKLFGTNTKIPQRRVEMRMEMSRRKGKWRFDSQDLSTFSPKKKLFAQLWGKACSVHNLATICSQDSPNNVESGERGKSNTAQMKTSRTSKNVEALNRANSKVLRSNELQSETTRITAETDSQQTVTTSSSFETTMETLPTTRVASTMSTGKSTTSKHFSLSTNDLSLNSPVIAVRPSSTSHQKYRSCSNDFTNPKSNAVNVCGAIRCSSPILTSSEETFSKLPDESSLTSADWHGRTLISSNESSIECIPKDRRRANELQMKNSDTLLNDWTVLSALSASSSFATLSLSSLEATTSAHTGKLK